MPSLKRTSWSPPHLVQVKIMHWMRGFTALILTTVPLTLTSLPVHVVLVVQQLADVFHSQMQMAHLQDVAKQQFIRVRVADLQTAPMSCIPIELDLSWRMCRMVEGYPSSLTTSFRGSRPSGRNCSACGLKRTFKAIRRATPNTYLPLWVCLMCSKKPVCLQTSEWTTPHARLLPSMPKPRLAEDRVQLTARNSCRYFAVPRS